MATTPPSAFWDDLQRHLENPAFRRAYVATSLEIQAVDNYANVTGRLPTRRARRRLRKIVRYRVSLPRWSTPRLIRAAACLALADAVLPAKGKTQGRAPCGAPDRDVGQWVS